MKKVLSSFIIGALVVMGQEISIAQDQGGTGGTQQTTLADTSQTSGDATAGELMTFHQNVKQKFIEGGVPYMVPILLCMILGLAIVIERIIYLNMATTNTNKLLKKIEDALGSGGTDAAKEICRNTRGPIASIFYQGLDRVHQGIDAVEKSVVSYGGVQMGFLERGMVWISLCIAMAPMLGFFGTVIGMVQAFEAIEIAGDISPGLVAGGIKVALITTIAGLIVAMALQVFYNYLLAKIDGLVSSMEDSSISLIDIIVKHIENKK